MLKLKNPVRNLQTSPAEPPKNRRSLRLGRRILHEPAALVGLTILVLLILLVALGPFLMPYPPAEIALENKLQPSSAQHWLGTDNLGRDILSRLLHGGRVTLGVAALVTGLVLVIGAAVGLVTGFVGGWLDDFISGISDLTLALPGLTLALALAGMLGPGLPSIILAMLPLSWVGYARLFRSLALSVREEEYILAARATGLKTGQIIRRHVLPNTIGALVVTVTLDLGNIMLAISSLSFLGLGIQPPHPEWGAMLNDGRTYLESAPQLVFYPAAAILLTALACNLLGDALRDALDPTTKTNG
jgi:peptide/nickel transport system permease protein